MLLLYYLKKEWNDIMIEDILFEKIKEYDTIIIHRHERPDLDALGSQIGLKLTLKNKFPNKKIYAVGDASRRYNFIGPMDLIEDSVYEGALAIIVDVAVSNMVSDDRYKLAKEVFVIDHHNNSCDITSNWICDNKRIAVGELITDLLIKNDYFIPNDAATAFYGAIVTDSGRFQYGYSSSVFNIAAKLVSFGANPKYIYDNIYVETQEERNMKTYFSNQIQFKDGVSFIKSDADVFKKFNVEFQDISRGMVNLMAGVKEVEIWCNFTYDENKKAVIGEFRSRSIPIVDVAKKYGGGGHLLACGATLKDFNEADLVINDFRELIKVKNGE